MRNRKRAFGFVLAASMVISLAALPAQATELYWDVDASKWYAKDIYAMQDYGIMNGTAPDIFSPEESLTLSQAITMVARTYAYERNESIPIKGTIPWYRDYLDYAAEKNICAMDEFGDGYTRFCSRITMAKLFERVIPAGTDIPLNNVESLPDVQNIGENEPVYHLYRLGVLTGNDSYGTFQPYQPITRAETSAILNRVLTPGNRKTVTIHTAPTREDIYNAAMKQAEEHFADAMNAARLSGRDYGTLDRFYYDIDKNGVEEMLVGFSQEPEAIYAIYAIQDYHAVCLKVGRLPETDGDTAEPCFLCPNGVIGAGTHDGNTRDIYYYQIASNGVSLQMIEGLRTISYTRSTVYRHTTTDEYGFKAVNKSTYDSIAARYATRLSIPYVETPDSDQTPAETTPDPGEILANPGTESGNTDSGTTANNPYGFENGVYSSFLSRIRGTWVNIRDNGDRLTVEDAGPMLRLTNSYDGAPYINSFLTPGNKITYYKDDNGWGLSGLTGTDGRQCEILFLPEEQSAPLYLVYYGDNGIEGYDTYKAAGS